MLVGGVNEWVDEQNGSVKYDMALQFDPEDDSQDKIPNGEKDFREGC